MKGIIALLTIVGAVAWAAPKLPVDEDIAELRAKADYLTALRDTLENNDCSLTIDKNTVKLVPGALRGEGLVIAVGENFPGNYLAYYKAPKPEQLENVVTMTLLKAGVGKNALILTMRIGNSTSAAAEPLLQIITNEPEFVKGTDSLWIYQKAGVTVKLPTDGNTETKTGKSYQGKALTLTCK
jgi:hypothetical protein